METRKQKKNDNEENSASGKKKILTQKEIETMEEILEDIREFHEKIVELEEIEVDFDNERNSSFLELNKYKKKLIELYRKGCEIKGIKADAGRPFMMNKNFKITGNEFVDRIINHCINEDYFNIPHFGEILECVRYCNEALNLEMSKSVEKSYAEIAYVKVVESLQRMRQRDFHSNYTQIYEETQDPAKLSRELWDKLIANESIGKENLNKILDHFVKKQHEELVLQVAKKRRSNPVPRKTRQRKSKKSPPKSDDLKETSSESGDSDTTNFSEAPEDPESIDSAVSTEKSVEFVSGNSAPNFAVSTLIEQNPGPSGNLISLSRVNTERGDYKEIQVIDEIPGDSVEESVDSIAEYFKNQPNSTLTIDAESEEVQSDEEEKMKHRERCLVM